MRLIEVGIGIMLRVPDGWDRFQHHGFMYMRDEFGHFVMRRPRAKFFDPPATRLKHRVAPSRRESGRIFFGRDDHHERSSGTSAPLKHKG